MICEEFQEIPQKVDEVQPRRYIFAEVNCPLFFNDHKENLFP